MRERSAASQPVTRPRRERTRRARARRPILCRACGEELSDESEVFSMTPSGPGGMFVNPHGIVHEVLTVRRVRNVVVHGGPTTEFSWFPGYAWEIAWCARCREHVGWSFTATGDLSPAVFWGLRHDAIARGG